MHQPNEFFLIFPVVINLPASSKSLAAGIQIVKSNKKDERKNLSDKPIGTKFNILHSKRVT